MENIDNNLLTVNHISKQFSLNKKQREERNTTEKTLTALDDFSMELNKGEIYGLLGPNGAGKTTALRAISSLIEPTQGEVLFCGKSIKEDIENYRKNISFLTSELKLDNFFTPSYTFTYMGRLYGMKEEEIIKRKEALFTYFGIDKFAETKIGNLSTGMKQKVSLAISLCHDPQIIIFDEPTNGLDIVASRDVEQFLIRQKEEGKAVLLSTHIFSLVEKLCDRVGILLEGKLRLEGSMKEVTKEKNLEAVFFDIYERGESK